MKNIKNKQSFGASFLAFIKRGNVIDMAVAVIIGAAFGKIVTSLVNNIIMPPVGMLIGGVDFKDLVIVLKAAEGDIPAVTLGYGLFIQTILEFIIIAFSVFVLVRIVTRLGTIDVKKIFKHKQEDVASIEFASTSKDAIEIPPQAAPVNPMEETNALLRDILAKLSKETEQEYVGQ